MTVTEKLKDQVKELLNLSSSNTKNEFFDSDFDSDFGKYDDNECITFKTALKDSGISVSHVDNYGGEDCGSEFWSVYEFSKGKAKVFVKFDGYYQSYNGSEFEQWFFAKAVPKSGFDYVAE